MNKFNHNQKLVSTSRNMLLILRIFFILLIFLIIAPWIAPTSKTGEFLMGMYGIPDYVKNIPFNIVVANFTIASRILGFIGSTISLLPLFVSIIIMLKVFKHYIKVDVFNLENAKSYSLLGVIHLLSAVFLQPLSQIFFSLCVSINNPVGQRFISFALDVRNLTSLFSAIMLIVIGQVMKLGQQISDEQQLTV